jgi:hypothetical protein
VRPTRQRLERLAREGDTEAALTLQRLQERSGELRIPCMDVEAWQVNWRGSTGGLGGLSNNAGPDGDGSGCPWMGNGLGHGVSKRRWRGSSLGLCRHAGDGYGNGWGPPRVPVSGPFLPAEHFTGLRLDDGDGIGPESLDLERTQWRMKPGRLRQRRTHDDDNDHRSRP